MTNEEAIKVLHGKDNITEKFSRQDLAEAEQLGIEALEIIEEIRVANGLNRMMDVIWDKVFKPLPSETE